MSEILNKIQKFVLALLIVCLPFQINSLIYQSNWGGGIYNPYTSINLTLTEILLYLVTIIFLFKSYLDKKAIVYGDRNFFLTLLIITSSFLISLLQSDFDDSTLKLLLAVKLLDILIFYILVVNKILSIKEIIKLLVFSMGFQAVIGILQFSLQSDLGLSFVGENVLNKLNPQVAKFYYKDVAILRSYGTFPHPNIFGAYLLISILLLLVIWSELKLYKKYFLLFVIITAVLLTFSRSTIIALIVSVFCLLYWYLKTLKIKHRLKFLLISGLLLSQILFLWTYRILSTFTDNSISERIEGYKNAISLFTKYPFGVGFNLSTQYLDIGTAKNFLPWEYQPPHNIYLLILSEQGFIGSLIFICSIWFLIYKILLKRKNLLDNIQIINWRIFLCIFISLFIISVFDHYLITLEQGRYLTILCYALFASFYSKKKNIIPIKRAI